MRSRHCQQDENAGLQLDVVTLVASLERYSKHPLARAILASATKGGIQVPEATEVSEPPGQGLRA